MSYTLNLVVSVFYISAGYMLVAGVTAASVTVVARKLHNKIAYGSLALLSLAGVGYQIATAFYYQTTSIEFSRLALVWQMDCATVGLVATYLFTAFESIDRQHPLRILSFAGALTAAMIIGNHLSGDSLHLQRIDGLQSFPGQQLAGLTYLRGEPGMGARIWYGTMAVVLIWGFGVAHSIWRQVSQRRAIFMVAYLLMLSASLIFCVYIDWGIRPGIYPLGFAFTLFVLVMSISLVMNSTRRSQALALRDREMQQEIQERRMAEQKLLRLSQVFMQEPAPIHIIDLNGNTLLVNEESLRFLRTDVSAEPPLNFFEVLRELKIERDEIIGRLCLAEECEFGPFFIRGGEAIASLVMARDCWATFKLYPIFDDTRQLRECVVRLEDVTERQFVNTAINTISNAVSGETGRAFFSRLAVQLARLLQKQYVFIGLTATHEQAQSLHTIAVAVDGELSENLVIPVHGSPVAKILERGEVFAHMRSEREYGMRPFLDNFDVQSFFGVAICNKSKQRVGAILVMDSKPMEQLNKFMDLAKIFVARIGTELERLEAEKTIRKMAYEDQLTGLPNRADLNEHITSLLKKPGASAFIQIDLDHFKTINDALGHDVGDEVIKKLAERLKNFAEANMFVARLGGDEFAVVCSELEKSPEKHTIRITRQILALMDTPVEVGDHLLDLGCTIGIVLFPKFAGNTIDVFRNADIALHKAKLAGRGGFQFFTPAMRDELSRRVALEKGLREALQRDELSLFYQPQVDGAGNLLGAEVLLRWRDSNSGYISPALFIPVAEETGLINPIGEWLMDRAIQTRKQWLDTGVPFTGYLSINVSAWQFARPDFVETTIAAIQKAELPPQLITLEITETAVLSDVRDTIAKMAELRDMGVSIALDDFGTGYSSLAYLRDLPLDALKIDKAFVDVLENQAQEPLVESMISIGEHMGLGVVAEGVQSPLQLERLKAMGCNAFQGYLFARPLCEADFLDWIWSRCAGPGQQRAVGSPEFQTAHQQKLSHTHGGQN